ncbi:MAG: hypothetical protein ACP5F6_08960 [Microbacter sp.]
MKQYVKQIVQTSKRDYYVAFLIGVLTIIGGFFLSLYWRFDPYDPFIIQIQTIDILLLLGSLPGILWLFHRQVRKNSHLASLEQRAKKYIQWVHIRFLVIVFNLVMNVLLLFLLRDFSYLLASAIVLVLLLMSRSNPAKVEEDLKWADMQRGKDDSEQQSSKDAGLF